MTDEIQQRLKDCADACLKSYDAWQGNKKDEAAREALQDAVHELRKVASRLEIEMAVSERDETNKKQIPIPAHRDARGRHQGDGGDDSRGNGSGQNKKPRRRNNNNAPKKAAGGEE